MSSFVYMEKYNVSHQLLFVIKEIKSSFRLSTVNLRYISPAGTVLKTNEYIRDVYRFYFGEVYAYLYIYFHMLL